MTLPKWMNTVTPFTKALALFLFVVLPFLGFFLGIVYQKSVTPADVTNYVYLPATTTVTPSVTTTTTPTVTTTAVAGPTSPVNTTGWKTYESKDFDIKFQYPTTWVVSTTDITYDNGLTCATMDQTNIKTPSKCTDPLEHVYLKNPQTSNAIYLQHAEKGASTACTGITCGENDRNIVILNTTCTMKTFYNDSTKAFMEAYVVCNNERGIPTGVNSNFKKGFLLFKLNSVDNDNLDIIQKIFESISQK